MAQDDSSTETLSGVHPAAICDALDAIGVDPPIMSAGIQPIVSPQTPVVGRAATARAVPVSEAPRRPYATLMEAIELLGSQDVWVVAAEGRRSAIFGGLLANAARARGAVACIVDGAVRDARELERLGFPTFATGLSPADSLGRDEIVEHGIPVRCGGVELRPGQLIIADADGIVAVPLECERKVVDHALAKVSREREMHDELRDGLPISDAFAKYGIL